MKSNDSFFKFTICPHTGLIYSLFCLNPFIRCVWIMNGSYCFCAKEALKVTFPWPQTFLGISFKTAECPAQRLQVISLFGGFLLTCTRPACNCKMSGRFSASSRPLQIVRPSLLLQTFIFIYGLLKSEGTSKGSFEITYSYYFTATASFHFHEICQDCIIK